MEKHKNFFLRKLNKKKYENEETTKAWYPNKIMDNNGSELGGKDWFGLGGLIWNSKGRGKRTWAYKGGSFVRGDVVLDSKQRI